MRVMRKPGKGLRVMSFEPLALSPRDAATMLAVYPMAGSEGGIMQRLIVGRLTATQLGGERLQEFRPEL